MTGLYLLSHTWSHTTIEGTTAAFGLVHRATNMEYMALIADETRRDMPSKALASLFRNGWAHGKAPGPRVRAYYLERASR